MTVLVSSSLGWLDCGFGRRGARGDHSCSQQHDDEHDDGDDDDHHHYQLDVLPPVGTCHLLRSVLEVLRLHTMFNIFNDIKDTID